LFPTRFVMSAEVLLDVTPVVFTVVGVYVPCAFSGLDALPVAETARVPVNRHVLERVVTPSDDAMVMGES